MDDPNVEEAVAMIARRVKDEVGALPATPE